ncbi:MAG: hypothetical protein IPL79_01295 [Myxococcales bacterium]|nr:hypothetical protein [Myxococcales bacterium]
MVFGLFSKEKSLDRTIEKAINKFAQHLDRFDALNKLATDGSPAALVGLCKRLGVTTHMTADDEIEKPWVIDTLVEKGEPGLDAIRTYMKTSLGLSLPLRVVQRAATGPRVMEIIDEVLASEKPGYTRDPQRRLDLLGWLAEWKADGATAACQRVVPYLRDFDENVRVAAADALAEHGLALGQAQLIDALVRPEEESMRFKRRVCGLLAEHKVALAERADEVAKVAGTISGVTVQAGVLVVA